MHAQLNAVDSVDAPDGLDRWVPDDAEAFAISVTATVGPVGSTGGGDLYWFQVVGARWFLEHPGDKGYRWPRGYLILDRWDLSVLERVLNNLCLHANGPDWGAVTAKLSRYGLSELD
jgi:hypothetical protein